MLQTKQCGLLAALRYEWRAGEYPLSPAFGHRRQIRYSGGFIDQAELQGTGGIEWFARYDHRQRHMMGQLADGAMYDAAMVDEPRPRFRQAELRVVGRYHNVGTHRHFEAKAKNMAVNDGYQWLSQWHKPTTNARQPAAERQSILPRGWVGNICPRTKGAIPSAGQDCNTNIGIAVDPRPRLRQRPVHLSIDGVKDRGPIEANLS